MRSSRSAGDGAAWAGRVEVAGRPPAVKGSGSGVRGLRGRVTVCFAVALVSASKPPFSSTLAKLANPLSPILYRARFIESSLAYPVKACRICGGIGIAPFIAVLRDAMIHEWGGAHESRRNAKMAA